MWISILCYMDFLAEQVLTCDTNNDINNEYFPFPEIPNNEYGSR